VFGSPQDGTPGEIAVETFFPTDARTAASPRAMAGQAVSDRIVPCPTWIS
jgi:hypothetical protein